MKGKQQKGAANSAKPHLKGSAHPIKPSYLDLNLGTPVERGKGEQKREEKQQISENIHQFLIFGCNFANDHQNPHFSAHFQKEINEIWNFFT
jgi:hypothetical protein